MYIEKTNIEVLQMSSNDPRTFDYQQRIALPAIDKLKSKLEQALEADDLGEIAAEILSKNLKVVSDVIARFKAQQFGQVEMFDAA